MGNTFRRALVTGSAGFIGSRVASTLLATGQADSVVGVDRFTDYYPRALKEANLANVSSEGFEFVDLDLAVDDLTDVLQGVDAIYHLAGQPGVRPSWGSSFDSYLRDNVRATQRLLEGVVAHSPTASFVNASSSSVYGDAEIYPTTEDTLPRPKSPYGVTKLAAEHLASLYARRFGLKVISLRYFTVYGPGQRPDMAFTQFCVRHLNGESLSVMGTGEQIREFTYVDDIVDATISSGFLDATDLVLNVSGGSAVSLNHCIAILGEISGKPVQRVQLDAAPGDVFRTGASPELVTKHLGWSPNVPIQEGLARQFEWAVANLALLTPAVTA